MKEKYVILMRRAGGEIKYPDRVTLTFTKAGAQSKVNRWAEEVRKYPTLYGIGSYEWDWDYLSAHPEYAKYVEKMDKYDKEKRRYDRLPASRKVDVLPPSVPKPPVLVNSHAVPQQPQQHVTASNLATPYLSTSDDYNKLALQVTDLISRIASLDMRIDSLTDACDDELDSQKAALVAFGDIIKGMDDRLEDLEHNLTK